VTDYRQVPYALIVDDEWRLGNNIARYLQRNGLAATAVTNVAMANQAITECRPALALVDLKLPDVRGVDLCLMLRRRYPDLPLVVMSARIAPEEQLELETAKVQGFLTKPFALSELVGLLDKLRLVPVGPTLSPTPTARIQGSGTIRRSPRGKYRRIARSARPRVVLYSHDTMGLGHMRRNILIARSLAESRLKANVLLVCGAREVGRFELPPGIDCLVLPSYCKSTGGDYCSRHLDLETRELVNLRAHTINVSVGAFNPGLMIVDNVPRGALHELDAVLTTLNARGSTHCVLGLRDVLDSPETVRREWADRCNLAAIQWHYDQVWVYGDPAVYNLCEAYGFGDDFTAKTRFTGYLDARQRAQPRAGSVPAGVKADPVESLDRSFNLCLVGGGQDGYELAKAFALSEQPAGTLGVLVTGPFMEPERVTELRQIAARRPTLQVLGFVQEPTRLLQDARRVVAMGGYNTVNEVLAFERPTMIVPRTRPRQEQLVRAQRLAELGHIDLLHPDDLDASRISRWLADPNAGRRRASWPIDLRGLQRLTDYAEALLDQQEIHHAIA
jgi:predicted glycosyltransferase